jgi:hypothetical protein
MWAIPRPTDALTRVSHLHRSAGSLTTKKKIPSVRDPRHLNANPTAHLTVLLENRIDSHASASLLPQLMSLLYMCSHCHVYVPRMNTEVGVLRNIHWTIIRPFTPSSPNSALSVTYSNTVLCIFTPFVRATCPTHLSLLDFINLTLCCTVKTVDPFLI